MGEEKFEAKGRTGFVNKKSKWVKRVASGDYRNRQEKKLYDQLQEQLGDQPEKLKDLLAQFEDKMRETFREDLTLHIDDESYKPIGSTGRFPADGDEIPEVNRRVDFLVTDVDKLEHDEVEIPIVQLQLMLEYEEAQRTLRANTEFDGTIENVEPPAVFEDQTGHNASIQARGHSTVVVRAWFLAREHVLAQLKKAD